jgi:hypothetical protein
MTSNDSSTIIECFEEFQEVQFDAGWCEAMGIVGGLEISETPSIEECERIYRLTGEPSLLEAVGSAR